MVSAFHLQLHLQGCLTHVSPALLRPCFLELPPEAWEAIMACRLMWREEASHAQGSRPRHSISGYAWSAVRPTCVQDGMLREGHPGGLGQEGGQRDALGLQLLVQGVKLVGGNGVAHAELWDLAMQQPSSQTPSSLLAHLDGNACKLTIT